MSSEKTGNTSKAGQEGKYGDIASAPDRMDVVAPVLDHDLAVNGSDLEVDSEKAAVDVVARAS
jgi:hypothetical protein